jgi:hypothetical protein
MSRRGLSYEDVLAITDPDVRALLTSEHPDSPKQRGTATKAGPSRPGRTQPRAGEPNKTEAKYGDHLADLKALGRVSDYAFEPMKLRLAGRTWLKIDYAVKVTTGLILVDVKGGPLEDDAAVKLKVCAEKYPWLPLYLVYRERGAWVYRAVTRSGIGGWCPEPF